MSTRLANIDPIKREPLATEIARRLVDYILSGAVEPGDRMPSERQLAEAFGVGRSAMREALKSLSLIGLIDVRQGDGTYLKDADASLLPRVIEWGLLLGEQRTMDLVEARQHIEAVLAGLAARRRTDAQVIELKRRLDAMERGTSNNEAFVEADVAFHVMIAEIAGNTILRDIHSGIQALLRAWIARVIASAGSAGPSFAEHIPIYEAIAAGDPAAAVSAMEHHMSSAADRLRRALPRDGALDRTGDRGERGLSDEQ